MKDLQKSALIVGVGASAGLGAAYGRRFAKAGYRVVLAGRSAEKVEASAAERSEEHTSELQSLMRSSYAVFCLKKKKTKTINRDHRTSKCTTKNSDNTDTNE